jgi:hypothetical protein
LPAYVPDPRIRKIPSVAGSKGASPPLSHADVKYRGADVSPGSKILWIFFREIFPGGQICHPQNRFSFRFHLPEVNRHDIPILPHSCPTVVFPLKKDAFHYLQFVNNYIICEDGLALHSIFSEIDPE